MAVKSVIEIDVQDDAFKAFIASFQKFQDAVKNLPGAWSEVTDAASGVTASIAKSGERISGNLNLISKQTEEHRKLQRQIEASNRSWAEFGRGTMRVASTVKDITLNLAKWGAVSGLLTGAGGFFGFRALAESSAQARRGALGLGITSGQFRAAETTYGRIGGAGNILSKISEMKQSPEGIAQLQRLGISAEDVASKNAGELLDQVLVGIQTRYRSFAPGLERPLSETYGLTEFGDLETIKRIADLQPGELPQMASEFARRSRELAVSDNVDRRYEDFLSRIGTASERLKVTLIDNLEKLSEPIANVVDAFTNLIASGINTPGFKEGIKSFADYIQELSTWLGSEEAKKSLRDFATSITQVVAGLGRMVAWLASWFPEEGERPPRESGDRPSPSNPQGERRNRNPFQRPLYPAEPMSFTPASYTPGGEGINFAGAVGGRFGRGGSGVRPITGGPGMWGEHFASLENRYGLPGGLLNSIYQLESGGGRNMGPSRSGALGPFQFMPATAQWLGLQDPMDTASSANAAARFMEYLLNRFSGDLEMAAASYNWGEGNVRRQVQRLGPRWREGLPEETRNYINRLMTGLGPNVGMIAAQPNNPVYVLLNNSTGGSVVASVNGLVIPGTVT
jgi:hypothetical protein